MGVATSMLFPTGGSGSLDTFPPSGILFGWIAEP